MAGSQVLKREQLLPSLDLQGVAEYIKAGKAKHIICMCGAGISVSAGIPDFRTPGTGLYSQLQRYNLPHPEAVFSIDYFRKNPKPFHMLAKVRWVGKHTAAKGMELKIQVLEAMLVPFLPCLFPACCTVGDAATMLIQQVQCSLCVCLFQSEQATQ